MNNSIIYEFVGSFLASFVKLYLILIFLKIPNILKNKRFWVSALVSGLYIFLSYALTDNFIKVILEFLIVIILCEYIVKFEKENLHSIVIIYFAIWIGMVLIDLFMSIILINIFNINIELLRNHSLLKFILNCFVFILLSLFFINGKIYKFIFNISYNIEKNKYIMLLTTLSVIMFSMSIYLCLFNYDIHIILVTMLFMIIIYSTVTIVTINEFNQKNRIQSEYDILLKNLNEYENLLDLQRVTNHENKNQLLVIKGMIDKGESNTSEYINSIIDTQYKDNDAIIYKTNRIPSGGLRGLIYYKILTMKEKKINSNLDVDRSLNELDFDNIPIKTNQELCKIVGVFLDNAIQAVSELKKKEIDIYLKYENDELYIKVSNNYSGVIELDKIDNSGYTTKGKGHGYGLSLVKGIIRENDCFKNDREIHGKMFSQIIRLKINED